MKKTYNTPEVEITKFDIADIITLSDPNAPYSDPTDIDNIPFN